MYFPVSQWEQDLGSPRTVPAAILSLLWGTELVTISAIKDTMH